jgi:hypothetical protein
MTVEVVSRGRGYVSQAGDVYIGRPSVWGNPFAIGRDGDRAEVVARYREYIESKPELVTALSHQAPRRLVCWCAPKACHGDVLAAALGTLPAARDETK